MPVPGWAKELAEEVRESPGIPSSEVPSPAGPIKPPQETPQF